MQSKSQGLDYGSKQEVLSFDFGELVEADEDDADGDADEHGNT